MVSERYKNHKKKAGEALIDKVFDMIENIDLFDQLADMIKSVVPLKAEITVKGSKALEVNVHGVKEGQLWISVKRIRKEETEEAEETDWRNQRLKSSDSFMQAL